MGSIKLTLPLPPSSNRYWRVVVPKGAAFANIYVSEEARRYKRQVKIAAGDAGIWEPIPGRVSVAVDLYPHRPLDWQKRVRADPMNWDDGVRCLDLDNCLKVLLDALRGVAFKDDAWVRKITAARMEPDQDGERVVITIEPIVRISPQPALFQSAAQAQEHLH
jgi:crossover junction endodeoxyribonuclease RusA